MPPAPPGAVPVVSVNETLSKLGMTREQFQAKQAELLNVLLRNQPFVPQNTTTRLYHNTRDQDLNKLLAHVHVPCPYLPPHPGRLHPQFRALL